MAVTDFPMNASTPPITQRKSAVHGKSPTPFPLCYWGREWCGSACPSVGTPGPLVKAYPGVRVIDQVLARLETLFIRGSLPSNWMFVPEIDAQ